MAKQGECCTLMLAALDPARVHKNDRSGLEIGFSADGSCVVYRMRPAKRAGASPREHDTVTMAKINFCPFCGSAAK